MSSQPVPSLQHKPWREIQVDKDPYPPTMLADDELALLYWLGSEYWRGEGEIIDAGCFLGGSTFALASGAKANPHVPETAKNGRVHTYDLFIVDSFEGHEGYLSAFPDVREGESFSHVFERFQAPHREVIDLHEGDVTKTTWPDEKDIEILFIDLAKTAEINDFVVKTYFPRLVPGKSVVIQQDYLFCDLPWIHITMEILRDYFRIIDDVPWASRVYLLEKPIPQEVIDGFDYRSIPFEKKLALFEQAQVTVKGTQWEGQLHLAKTRLHIMEGHADKAPAMIAEVFTKYADSPARSCAPMFFPEFFAMAEPFGFPEAFRAPDLSLISQTSHEERLLLYALVAGLKPDRLLEIGRARGGSTVVLASAVSHNGKGTLVSMDPNTWEEHKIHETLRARLIDRGVIFLDAYSPAANGEAVAKAGGLFDFVFIDGDHSYDGCLRDILGAIPFVKPGTFFVLHDAHFGGVQDAVAQAMREHPLADCGSLCSGYFAGFAHQLYNGKPSFYSGLQLLQFRPDSAPDRAGAQMAAQPAADAPAPAIARAAKDDAEAKLRSLTKSNKTLESKIKQLEKDLKRMDERRFGNKLKRSLRKRLGGGAGDT
ncbi:hypothetical protein BH23VER1_BH23VER1_20010 [soil metagenome]